MEDVAREQEARVPEDQAEQPDNPAGAGAGIVGEVDHKAGKVDLGLEARRRLEAHLVRLRAVLRSDRGEEALYRRTGTGVAQFTYLAGQARRAEDRQILPDASARRRALFQCFPRFCFGRLQVSCKCHCLKQK